MVRLPRPLRGLLLFVASAALLGSAALAQNPPASPSAHAVDSQAELTRLADQASHLDPKAPNYPARVKAILEGLIRVNQSLARENAALKAQTAPAPRTTKTRRAATGMGGGAARSGAQRPAGAAPAAAPNAEVGPLFGKRGLTKYHRAGCTFGERIKQEDRVYFATPAAAGAAGYEPCKVCHPEAFVPPAPATAPKPP